MLRVLAHPAYARLFAAQVIALLGTGLMTVALGLLAYDLAGERAGLVLGTALGIKMVAYVGLAPVAAALAARLPRRAVLIGADLIRAAVALCLPFIDAVWQVYGLIFVLQAASATFTPTFQAVIPDILPEERDYTRALSLSRLAYDIENIASPALAGLLLAFMSFHWLFLGTVVGFLVSAALVRMTQVPDAGAPVRRFRDRLTRGLRIYLATPRLRGLLALNFVAAAAGAFILVNTVVLVRATYGGTDGDVALALAAFGAGSMAAALLLPRLLDHLADRKVMLAAAGALALLTLGHAAALLLGGPLSWPALLSLWAASGAAYSAVLTPSGRLLRRSSDSADRPALFAAQFALSHAAWLFTYLVAGWGGALFGLGATLAMLGALAALGMLAALRLWPAHDPEAFAHRHPELAPGHPHLKAHAGPHSHVVQIDDLHPSWPKPGA